MQQPNMILLYVENPQASLRFYQDLTGAAGGGSSNFCVLPFPNGLALGLWAQGAVAPAPDQTGARMEIVLAQDSAAQVTELWESWRGRGYRVLQPLCAMDFGPTFVIADPDGHRIRVCPPDA